MWLGNHNVLYSLENERKTVVRPPKNLYFGTHGADKLKSATCFERLHDVKLIRAHNTYIQDRKKRSTYHGLTLH